LYIEEILEQRLTSFRKKIFWYRSGTVWCNEMPGTWFTGPHVFNLCCKWLKNTILQQICMYTEENNRSLLIEFLE